MEKQDAEFTLTLQKTYGSDSVSASLHFKRSNESDLYFFNKYELQLKKEGEQSSLRQTFYTNRGITLKEGYNLLDARAIQKTLVNKDNQRYQAWLQLDFKSNAQSGNYEIKQYHQNYGYDLEKVLSKYPIKELSNEKFKDSLIKSLQRGNLQSATFLLAGKEQKIFLTPNLAFKTLNAFNDNMQKISLSEHKLKNEENSPVRKPRKKQKITQ
jgi:hypothetical protein